MRIFNAKDHRKKAEATEWILNHPGPLVIECDEPRRTNVRNAQLHAVLTDIAQQLIWDGERLSVEQWKRLLVAAWMRATNRRIKIARAIDGTGFDPIYQRTSKLSEGETRELIQFVYAWGVDQNVRFKEPGEERAA